MFEESLAGQLHFFISLATIILNSCSPKNALGAVARFNWPDDLLRLITETQTLSIAKFLSQTLISARYIEEDLQKNNKALHKFFPSGSKPLVVKPARKSTQTSVLRFLLCKVSHTVLSLLLKVQRLLQYCRRQQFKQQFFSCFLPLQWNEFLLAQAQVLR